MFITSKFLFFRLIQAYSNQQSYEQFRRQIAKYIKFKIGKHNINVLQTIIVQHNYEKINLYLNKIVLICIANKFVRKKCNNMLLSLNLEQKNTITFLIINKSRH